MSTQLKYQSHIQILELWKPVVNSQSQTETQESQPWRRRLAADITKHMKGLTVPETRVRHWWIRDRIPVEYFPALVAAAAARGFRGVTLETLVELRVQDLLRKAESEGALAA